MLLDEEIVAPVEEASEELDDEEVEEAAEEPAVALEEAAE
jgi:hypothetical protein